MTQHAPRTHLDVDHLDELPTAGQPRTPIKAHANPHRAARGMELARDDRHAVRRHLHDVERGIDPDELD